MTLDSVWAGISFEWGGEAGFGSQRQMGALISLGDLVAYKSLSKTRYFTFDQMAISLGAGLGGGVAANFLVGVNSTEPLRFSDGSDDTSFDWSLDLAFVHLSKYLYSIPDVIEMAALAKQNWKNVDSLVVALKTYDKNAWKIKTVAENLIKNGGNVVSSTKGAPTILSFPIPGASEGIRISARLKKEARIVTSWGTLG